MVGHNWLGKIPPGMVYSVLHLFQESMFPVSMVYKSLPPLNFDKFAVACAPFVVTDGDCEAG